MTDKTVRPFDQAKAAFVAAEAKLRAKREAEANAHSEVRMAQMDLDVAQAAFQVYMREGEETWDFLPEED